MEIMLERRRWCCRNQHECKCNAILIKFHKNSCFPNDLYTNTICLQREKTGFSDSPSPFLSPGWCWRCLFLFQWMMLNWRRTREGFVESWITNFQFGVESLIRSSRPQNRVVPKSSTLVRFSIQLNILLHSLISVMDFWEDESKKGE